MRQFLIHTLAVSFVVSLHTPAPPAQQNGARLSRRACLASTSAAFAALQLPAGATAATTTLASVVDATLALSDGAQAAAISLRPTYGLESYDVAYPEWFLGKWQATSTLESVIAPAGVDLFSPGRNGTVALQRARGEIGPQYALRYDVRWRKQANPDNQVDVVVDRGYNVASISRAAMGEKAVQEVIEEGPNRLTTYLTPKGAPAGLVYAADLRVVSRRTDPPDASRPNLFVCAETTRQTVTAVSGEKAASNAAPKSPLIKEIETIVTYERDDKDPNLMRGYQRTATFLVPDAAYTGDPKLAELAAARLTSFRGRLVAVDVRTYGLEYRRLS
jgi:hypothetical protein